LAAVPSRDANGAAAKRLEPKLIRAKRLADANKLISDAAAGKNSIYYLHEADNFDIEPLLKADRRDPEALKLKTRATEVLLATTTKNPQDRTTLILLCQNAVMKTLKAPSTADFPWPGEETIVDHGAWRYTVQSYVDAQNSFGAKIRTPFRCEILCSDIGQCSLGSLELQ
jgi:hypothetical protein